MGGTEHYEGESEDEKEEQKIEIIGPITVSTLFVKLTFLEFT